MQPQPHALKQSQGYAVSEAGQDESKHVSKLEAEVRRLEVKGSQLVQTEGQEVEGIALLEKALRTRGRFPALNADAWQRAEQFVDLPV